MPEPLFLIKACNFIKKETLAQVFSCELCEIFRNTFSHRTPVVASGFQYLSCLKLIPTLPDKCNLFFNQNPFNKFPLVFAVEKVRHKNLVSLNSLNMVFNLRVSV